MINHQSPALGVNIDHIATLRQARGTHYPDPVQAALMVEEAGADNITVHLREDRRHIQERDVKLIKEVMLTTLNLEMAVTEEMLRFAEQLKPKHCCLVPEKREELTTEGGLNVIQQEDKIRAACQRLAQAGIEVSIFIDPDLSQLEAAKCCGAPAVEIHTGAYADAQDATTRVQELTKIQNAARFAKQAGFIVNAGHGLNYQNVHAIVAVPEFSVLNIGHSIIARAVFTGLQEAVREMKQLMHRS
jgi:pyridoxine 5-phosphate synthase